MSILSLLLPKSLALLPFGAFPQPAPMPRDSTSA